MSYFYVGYVNCIYLGTMYAIFQEKISQRFLGKSSKLFIVVTLQRWKLWTFFPEISAQIFLKIGIHSAKVYTKNFQTVWLYPCPAQNSVYQASHCSALLIGWLDFCSRLYIFFKMMIGSKAGFNQNAQGGF